MEEDFMETRIFVESSEHIGLLYVNYKNHPKTILLFLDKLEAGVKLLLTSPDEQIDLMDDISKFKKDITIKHKPDEIDLDEISSSKKGILAVRKSIDDILSRLAKLKSKTAFGGNYYRAIIRKPKVYAKTVDDVKYGIINSNIRSINRALDWV